MAFASGRKREEAQKEENGGENRNKTETAKMWCNTTGKRKREERQESGKEGKTTKQVFNQYLWRRFKRGLNKVCKNQRSDTCGKNVNMLCLDIFKDHKCPTKGRMTAPNRMNFRENSRRPSAPTSFSENYVANLLQWICWSNICKEVRVPDSIRCMHTISRDRDHSEGWGSTAISENSSDMVAWPVPEGKFYKEAFHQFILISCQVEMFKLGRGAWSDAQSVYKLCIFWGVPKRPGIEFYRLL